MLKNLRFEDVIKWLWLLWLGTIILAAVLTIIFMRPVFWLNIWYAKAGFLGAIGFRIIGWTFDNRPIGKEEDVFTLPPYTFFGLMVLGGFLIWLGLQPFGFDFNYVETHPKG